MPNPRRSARQRNQFSQYRTASNGIITAVTTLPDGRRMRMEVGRTEERRRQDRAAYRAQRKAAGLSTG